MHIARAIVHNTHSRDYIVHLRIHITVWIGGIWAWNLPVANLVERHIWNLQKVSGYTQNRIFICIYSFFILLYGNFRKMYENIILAIFGKKLGENMQFYCKIQWKNPNCFEMKKNNFKTILKVNIAGSVWGELTSRRS